MASDRATRVIGPQADAVEHAVPAEQVVEAVEGTLTVVDHHVRMRHTGSRHVIELRADQIRRVQLDFEVGRPATLSIVPNSGSVPPTVVNVSSDHFAELAAAILHLAADLADVRR